MGKMTNPATSILVVDDDEAGRYLKVHRLRRSGYNVVGVEIGRAHV